METKKVSFKNKNNLRLAGYIDSPTEVKPHSFAVFSHCFTCSKDLKSIGNINRALASSGIASLRFDFTGIGESEGDFSETNYSGYIDDLLSSFEFLNKNYEPPKLLIGHSLGGCIAIETASRIPSVKAVAVIGTPSEPSNLSVKLRNARLKTKTDGLADVEIGGILYKFKNQFFEDIETHLLEPFIRNLSVPLLIMHSPEDKYTDFENAGIIFKTAKSQKSFISLDGIDHLMLKKNDASYVGNLIASWSYKYLTKD